MDSSTDDKLALARKKVAEFVDTHRSDKSSADLSNPDAIFAGIERLLRQIRASDEEIAPIRVQLEALKELPLEERRIAMKQVSADVLSILFKTRWPRRPSVGHTLLRRN